VLRSERLDLPEAILRGEERRGHVSLYVRRLELAPRPVPDMKDFNRLSLLADTVDHTINRMRPMAIKNLP
jgi:hypothetical protein